MYHLVVKKVLPTHKVGSLITDPAVIAKILAGPAARSVVKIFDHLTHAGVPKAAAPVAPSSPASPAPAPTPATAPIT